jgi:hypothetical protein
MTPGGHEHDGGVAREVWKRTTASLKARSRASTGSCVTPLPRSPFRQMSVAQREFGGSDERRGTQHKLRCTPLMITGEKSSALYDWISWRFVLASTVRHASANCPWARSGLNPRRSV